jgi:hypothetical protein
MKKLIFAVALALTLIGGGVALMSLTTSEASAGKCADGSDNC